jgi:hypothetical protein
MGTEWSPSDYAWNAELCVAENARATSPSDEIDTETFPKMKNGKRRHVKNLPKIICQIDGCGIRLEASYYRVRILKSRCLFRPTFSYHHIYTPS